MADSFSMRIDGLFELQQRMLAFPGRVQRNVARRATWAGAAVIRADARQRAPVWTGPVSEGHPPPGTLKRAIVAAYADEKATDTQTVTVVTVRHGKRYQKQGKKGNLSQDAFYWWWVEFGNARIGRNSYMRPAFEAKKIEAKDAIVGSLRVGIDQEAAKL